MLKLGRRRALAAVVAALAVIGTALAAGRLDAGSPSSSPLAKLALGDFQSPSQGIENGGSGGEAFEALTASQQFAEARTAPGIVAPGAYSAAYAQLTGLGQTGGAWQEVTATKYDADDPNYRDYYSNSSGGAGLVTGRIVGVAADGSGTVYAAGADGGVWRSTTGGGKWTPIADALPSLSSGDLQLDPSNGSLWFATGEANTGGTSYVGSGVYRLTDPKSQTLTPASRVGGTELESTTINAIRFAPTTVWIATLRGVYTHARNGDMSTPWTRVFAPSPSYLPGGANAGTANAAYKNIVNDVAIDPRNPNHVIAAAAWRSGDTYNGFYETTDGGSTWAKNNPQGSIDTSDVGNVTFAYAGDGSKLYLMNQSPRLLNKLTGTVNSLLDGIYVSNTGNAAGPWSKIAESTKLANSGSALKQAVGGKGYGPGIQAWYNQFLTVDPSDPNHVFAGLEEVYETKNGGSSWTTVGPYWNFYFSCWRPDVLYAPNGSNGCPLTTHSDQHAVAVGTYKGKQWLYVGNDGGIYKRPLNGSVDADGHATDWESLNDGSIDALQYYAVGVGLAKSGVAQNPAGTGAIVSGGLQDNGGSIFRIGGAKMSSNFGGDGGDVLVDPQNGCNIVQEYVYLSMSVTQTCAHPETLDAFLDLSKSTTYKVGPPDVNARFIAPFSANDKNIEQWLAGGNSLWFQTKGFAIRRGSEWQKVYMLPDAGKVYTAVAYSGNVAVAGWCGPCNNAGFTRGVSVGTYDNAAGKWTFKEAALDGVPNRYVGGLAVGPNGHLFLAMNGFSRRFTEGPGAGIGHVYESADGGATWTSIDGNFPDVPANSIKALSNGALVVGTDLGVVYRAAGSTTWTRLGGNLPLTVAIDVELGPDGYVYAATHGRGIWRIAKP